MELDDLKSPLCSWTTSPPLLSPGQIYMAVWEKVLFKNKKVTEIFANEKAQQFKSVSSESDVSSTLDNKSTVSILKEGRNSKQSPLELSKKIEDRTPASHIDVSMTSEDSGVSIICTSLLPETKQLVPKLKSVSENSAAVSPRHASDTKIKTKSEHTSSCNSDLVQKPHSSSTLLQNSFKLEDNLDNNFKTSTGDGSAVKYPSVTRVRHPTSKRSLQSCGTEKGTSVSVILK